MLKQGGGGGWFGDGKCLLIFPKSGPVRGVAYLKGAHIQIITVYLTLNVKLNLHEVPRDLRQKLTFTILMSGLALFNRYMYSCQLANYI